MNTKITINRAVLAHALDALDADIAIPPGSLFHESFRASLAEQPVEQVPVAWMYEWNGRTFITTSDQRPIEHAHPHFSKSKPLYTAPQPAIPPGYKLVPVEPTEEMLAAAERDRTYYGRVAAIFYRAMLNAAPEAPQPAKRVKLTNKEVDQLLDTLGVIGPYQFAHAVIAAYDAKNGITGEQS